MRFFRFPLLALVIPVWLSAVQGSAQAPPAEPKLTVEEMKQFLLTAKVVKNRRTSKGITRPYRLTLSDGRLTHDAGFQPVDIYRAVEKMQDGTTEINFRDTYHFNLAAYELAKLLDVESMMPVTVMRKWDGKTGSLTWWLKVIMDDNERQKKGIEPPDVETWNRQMYRRRVFAELVYDNDPNATNVLIGENWEVYMIDFTRAFRLHERLHHPEELRRCDGQLLEKLRQLNKADVERVAGLHLKSSEIKALMARRDKILDHFRTLIQQKGEAAVLY